MDATQRMQVLAQRVSEARRQVERRQGEANALRARQRDLQESLAEAQARVEVIGQAALLLKEAGDYARDQARIQVEALTSSALQAVFGMDYEFRLESGDIGGRPAVWCQVVSPYGDGDQLQTEGTDARGGGIVDLQAIALRIAMLETSVPTIDGPLLLDEPCKHVSAEHIPAAGEFLQMISQQFGRQLIMVTHNQHLAALADQTIEVVLRDGASMVSGVA